MLRVNLTGPMFGCKHAIPPMVRQGRGSIINTASISGLTGELYLSAYAVAKAGVMHLTRTVAGQYGKQGIRCNSVCPGFTLSPPGRTCRRT